MNPTTYWSFLWKELRRPPFLILLAIFLLCMTSETWLMWDGAQFHLTNYFRGKFSNSGDFTRLLSVVFTQIGSVTYERMGGTSFWISKSLYQFGYVYHIFLPFFLLVYLKYKEPELTNWADRSQNFYLLSLVSYFGCSYLFYMSEMKIAHTLTWMSIFSFRAQSESHGNAEFKDRCFWTISVLALFTYPITLFSNSFMLAAQFLFPKDRPSQDRKDSRWFLFTLLVSTFALVYIYYHLWPQFTPGSMFLQNLPNNKTIKYLSGTIVLLFILRPLLKKYLLLLAPLFAYGYIAGNYFDPWHSYNGRLFGVLIVILIQFSYILLEPFFKKFDWNLGLRDRTYAFSIFVLLMMFHQDMRLKTFHGNLLAITDKEKRILTYEEVYDQIDWPTRSTLSDYFCRQKIISFYLMRGNKDIDRYIDKKKTIVIKDLFDIFNGQMLNYMLKRKNLTMSAPIIPR